MDRFNSLYNHNENETKWIESLKRFNEIHSNDSQFESKYGSNNKSTFSTNLFDILKREFETDDNKPSSTAIHQALTALRISLREQIPSEESILLTNLPILFKFGNVGEDERVNIYSDEIREEALKSLLNSITRNKDIQSKFFGTMNGPLLLTKELIRGVDDKVAFPIYKILIHSCTVPLVRDVVCGAGLMDHVVEQLEQRTTGDFQATTILGDLFRLAFTATMHLGQLDQAGKSTKPTDDELARTRRLFPIYKRIYTYHCDRNHQMYSIKMVLISTLLNVPTELLDELVDEIGLNYFQQILLNQIDYSNKPDAPGQLIPILMLLANIAEHVKSTRDELLKYTFPPELTKDTDEPLSVAIEAPEEAVTKGLSSKLIPLMTSSDIGLKHFVCEYLYYICDEDANEVCRLTGYGNAAGLLVTKGLMSLGGK